MHAVSNEKGVQNALTAPDLNHFTGKKKERFVPVAVSAGRGCRVVLAMFLFCAALCFYHSMLNAIHILYFCLVLPFFQCLAVKGLG